MFLVTDLYVCVCVCVCVNNEDASSACPGSVCLELMLLVQFAMEWQQHCVCVCVWKIVIVWERLGTLLMKALSICSLLSQVDKEISMKSTYLCVHLYVCVCGSDCVCIKKETQTKIWRFQACSHLALWLTFCHYLDAQYNFYVGRQLSVTFKLAEKSLGILPDLRNSVVRHLFHFGICRHQGLKCTKHRLFWF